MPCCLCITTYTILNLSHGKNFHKKKNKKGKTEKQDSVVVTGYMASSREPLLQQKIEDNGMKCIIRAVGIFIYVGTITLTPPNIIWLQERQKINPNPREKVNLAKFK